MYLRNKIQYIWLFFSFLASQFAKFVLKKRTERSTKDPFNNKNYNGRLFACYLATVLAFPVPLQVFDSIGKFLFEFGSYGSGEGEFDCPAGVSVNRIGQFIVSDRYNHRVQLFDPTGRFLRAFGCEGRTDGRFNYPWGIATDSLGFIYVCDRENHRVQVRKDLYYTQPITNLEQVACNFRHSYGNETHTHTYICFFIFCSIFNFSLSFWMLTSERVL